MTGQEDQRRDRNVRSGYRILDLNAAGAIIRARPGIYQKRNKVVFTVESPVDEGLFVPVVDTLKRHVA